MDKPLLGGEVRPLLKRGITEETCRHFGYLTGYHGDKPCQLAPYYDKDGALVAQKVRYPGKDFSVRGELKEALLFGQQLWRDGGKKVVITEGEIDAMSVSQLQNNKWPVVSIPNGAQGAKKALSRQLEWLEKFDEVILMFDMDEPGKQAVEECAPLFKPGRCKVARLPLKDANEMLQASRGGEVIDAIWGAKTYRPDGIVAGADLWDVVGQPDADPGVPYPWKGLNEKLMGARRGELVTITAGSGIGKSAVVREVAYHLLQQGETVGLLMLEETVKRTGLGLMGLGIGKPLHLSREGVTEESLKAAYDATLGTGRVFLYDHFGSTAMENLLAKVRYMAKALDCRWIILDHLSIVVSGIEGDDERKLIDLIMTRLRTLVQECDIGMFVVSHLRRPEGKGHEEGALTSLSQLRGSHAIAQLSDGVIGLERNQQGDDPNVTTVRVLKNRYSGDTGVACQLRYDKETGRLQEESEFDFGKDEGPDAF